MNQTILQMHNKLLQNKIQITILFTIFVFFLMNGIGALNFHFRSGNVLDLNFVPLLSIASQLFFNPINIQSVNILLILLTGTLLSVLLPVLTPIYASLTTILVATLHLYFSISVSKQLSLPMEYSLLIIFILYSTNALIIYFIQTHSRQKIITLFGQFVPPEIVNELSNQQGKLDMDGESKILTVFFCDLWKFSNIAEQLNPKQLTKLLNEYFDSLTEILFRHGATIDKYIGDSIMAFWGAPVKQPDHAQRAVSASFDMHEKIQLLSKSFTHRGWPGPTMGIGINTGVMNVGNMGSKYRVAYTVIGDAVNLASRIETLTRKYQVPTLVSESTKLECPDFTFRFIDIVQVKGKRNLTKIYQPICRKSELSDNLKGKIDQHQEGIEYYLQSDYENARKIFTELRISYENDGYYPAILKILDTEVSSH